MFPGSSIAARELKMSAWDPYQFRQSLGRNKYGPCLLLCDLASLRETGLVGATDTSPEEPHAKPQRRKERRRTIRSQFSLECAVEDGRKQGVQLRGALGLQAHAIGCAFTGTNAQFDEATHSAKPTEESGVDTFWVRDEQRKVIRDDCSVQFWWNDADGAVARIDARQNELPGSRHKPS